MDGWKDEVINFSHFFLWTENPTYDASGSASLQSDPTATAAAPFHPLADPLVVEEVPFSVIHPDGEGEGLLGQPAFSSVLTVMAGTVKHPVSLDQSRTLPTISRDDTHTTQWPSHISNHGSDKPSLPSSAGGRILTSSGVIPNMSPPQDAVMASTVPCLFHASFTEDALTCHHYHRLHCHLLFL